MSAKAWRARRRNLSNARLRSQRESRIIKLLVWQAYWASDKRPSERAVARQLGVWPSYVHKLWRCAHTVGSDALLQHGRPVTLDDLMEARDFTATVREQAPELLAPPRRSYAGEYSHVPLPSQPSNPYQAMAHAKTLREWQEVDRRSGRRVLFSVPVR